MPPDWYIGSINLQTNYYQSTWDWMPGQAGKLTLTRTTMPRPTAGDIWQWMSSPVRTVKTAILQVNRLGDVTQALDVPYEIEGKAENNLDFAELPGVFHLRLGSGLERCYPSE